MCKETIPEKEEDKIPADENRCWCPCDCGCTPDVADGKLTNEVFLCQDCIEGFHEIPPEKVFPGVDDLIPLVESFLEQLRKISEERKNK